MNYLNAYHDNKYNSKAIEVIEIHKKMLLDEKLSRDKIYNDFLNPQLTADNMDLYIVRKSILNTLNGNMHQFNGTLLDLGCGEMPYKNYILSNSKVEKYIIKHGLYKKINSNVKREHLHPRWLFAIF